LRPLLQTTFKVTLQLLTYSTAIVLVLPDGYDPSRPSPSDRSPNFIRVRRYPKLRSINL